MVGFLGSNYFVGDTPYLAMYGNAFDGMGQMAPFDYQQDAAVRGLHDGTCGEVERFGRYDSHMAIHYLMRGAMPNYPEVRETREDKVWGLVL